MPDVGTVIANLRGSDQFRAQANDPRIQFRNRQGQNLIGAQLMPEVSQDNNSYTEEDIILLDVAASDLGAYDPPVVKAGGIRTARFRVELGDSGLALQMSPKDYSNIVRMLGRAAPMETIAETVMNFSLSLTLGMTVKNEAQRWNAIRNARVVRVIDEVAENIDYPQAPGQRTALVSAWSDNAYDPYPDVLRFLTLADSLGYPGVARLISRRKPLQTFLNNQKVAQRTGGFVGPVAGNIYYNAPSKAKLDASFAENNLPAWETYDAWYQDQAGRNYYLPDDTVVAIFDTGRPNDVALELEAQYNEPYVPDNGLTTIGYYGVGTTSGHEDRGPGRWQNVTAKLEEARPHVFGEGVQKGLPVFQDPFGFGVYTNVR